MSDLGYDEHGQEIAVIEFKNCRIGGDVTAELRGPVWHVEIDCGGGRKVHGVHETRDGALYLALGECLGIKATIHAAP